MKRALHQRILEGLWITLITRRLFGTDHFLWCHALTHLKISYHLRKHRKFWGPYWRLLANYDSRLCFKSSHSWERAKTDSEEPSSKRNFMNFSEFATKEHFIFFALYLHTTASSISLAAELLWLTSAISHQLI